MIPLGITLNIESHPWTELTGKNVLPGLGTIIKIGRLPHGCESGASTVSVIIQMSDGKLVAGQTTLALLQQAIRAISIADEAQPEN